MTDSEKPFACTSVGCNMSFVNEDHLTVHKKKHDMMLNLGINNKNNFFVADQTPTPTRFIRNCDEVGLFQDLHNENPFEETFRRAVEGGKSEIFVPELQVDINDSLHTPNIFPHVSQECISSINTESIQSQKIKVGGKCFSDSQNSTQSVLNKEAAVEEINCNIVSKENTIDQSIPDSSSDNVVKPTDGGEMQLILKTQDGKILQFVAASVADCQGESLNLQKKENVAVKTKILPNNCDNNYNLKTTQDHKLIVAKKKLKEVLIKSSSTVENKTTQNNENEIQALKLPNDGEIDHSKKLAILERNRASSMRARAKRKAWIEELQESLKNANETNANLQVQVKNLNSQVAKLKELLIAHKDCPVTKAMEQESGILNSNVLTVTPNEMKSTIVSIGHTKPTKRINKEKVLLSKKKPVILSTIKSAVILPKTYSSMNTITLHRAEGIKQIPTISVVAPFVTNVDNSKESLSFLRTDSGKV